jgi:hypothetical protein
MPTLLQGGGGQSKRRKDIAVAERGLTGLERARAVAEGGEDVGHGIRGVRCLIRCG